MPELSGAREHPYGKEHPINILDHLNDEQKAVVTHFNGPLLVLAGAGSGKTRTIIHRIAYLVDHYGVAPSSIIALTFTNKAAREMQKRLLHFPNSHALRGVLTSTFHSFGLMFLKEVAQETGAPQYFQIIDDEDQLKLLKETLLALNISADNFPPKTFRGVIDTWKNQGLSLDDFIHESFFAEYIKQVYSQVLRKYEALKHERSLLDFGDLLLKMLEVLETRPDILKRYQQRFQYILVDEYQDTNSIQYKIIKKLSAGARNIAVVGDDDQSIYSFRGAEIRNILDFKKDFPDVTIVKLTRNYRSSRTILDAANAIIARNRQRMAKDLVATRDEGEKITLVSTHDEKEEASFVLKTIKEMVGGGRTYRDIAIFYRTNVLSRRFEDVLRREKMPYKIFGSIRFYNRREVKDMLSLIKLLLNRSDVLSFTRIAHFAMPGIGKTTLEKILGQPSARKDVCAAVSEFYGTLNPGTKIALTLKSFLTLIETLSEALAASTPQEFIDIVFDRTGYVEHLRKDVKDEKELDERLKNIDELKIALTENRNDGKEYRDFINEVVLEDIEKEDVQDYVTLMTVHSAKGLEFPVVFITGLEDDIFPHIYSKMEHNQEEERRLFYVAITRAKERLFLSHARSRNNKFQRVSPFLEDIPDHLILSSVKGEEAPPPYSQRTYTREPEQHAAVPPQGFRKKVFHEAFGRGEIVGTIAGGDDPVFLVKFENNQMKKIMGSYLKAV